MIQKNGISFKEFLFRIMQSQKVLLRVTEHTAPAEVVPRVYDHPAHNIAWQKEITNLKAAEVLPPSYDYSEMDSWIVMMKRQL